MLIAFNKPFGVLSQFTTDGSANRTLSVFDFPKNVYPIGRLDADSEGLLILSDEPEWNERLLHPRHAHEREYWAQVERVPTTETLKNLAQGVSVQSRKTLPCRAWILEPQPEEVGASRRDARGGQLGPSSVATLRRVDATGFIRLNALRLKVAAKVQKKK
jgi:23S rRNA pseudouridine2457 synthase